MSSEELYKHCEQIEEEIYNKLVKYYGDKSRMQYGRACLLISYVGMKRLQALGYNARMLVVGTNMAIQVVGPNKTPTLKLVMGAHAVIKCQGQLIDLKRRCFRKYKELPSSIQKMHNDAGYDKTVHFQLVKCSPQEGGYYPLREREGEALGLKHYKQNVKAKHFSGEYRTEFRVFNKMVKKNTLRQSWKKVAEKVKLL